MGYLLEANSTWIHLSLRIWILIICMQTFTMICIMLCCMTHNFHTYGITSFCKSGRKLLPRRTQTSILHSKNYLEAGSRWFLLRNLRNNIILSMTYTFRFPLRSFYYTSNLYIFVINTSTTITNILMDTQILAKLLLKYLINDPIESKIGCTKLHLAMGPLMFLHNHIKVSWFILNYLAWLLMTVNERLYMK